MRGVCVHGSFAVLLQPLIEIGLKAYERDGLRPTAEQREMLEEIFAEAAAWRCRMATPATPQPTTAATVRSTYSAKEVADMLGVSKQAITGRWRRKTLEGHKDRSGRLVFTHEALVDAGLLGAGAA